MGAGVRMVSGLKCTLPLEVRSHGLKMRCWLPFPETTVLHNAVMLLAQCVTSGKDASVNCTCVCTYMHLVLEVLKWWVRFFLCSRLFCLFIYYFFCMKS